MRKYVLLDSGAGGQILNGTGISIQGMTSGWGEVLSFHIAPSNIPAMFAWSMAIGLLADNSNIIRISSRTAGQGMRLKELIGQMLSEEKKSDLAGLSQGNL